MAETHPAEESLTIRNRIRINGGRLLHPEGNSYRMARLALEAYRQARGSGGELVRFARSQSVSYMRPFAYSRWLDSVASDPAELDHMADSIRGIVDVDVAIVVLPGPGPVETTIRSIESQVRRPSTVIRADVGHGDGLAVLAETITSSESTFVMAVACGDELAPEALARIVDVVDADPRAWVVTWDDDVHGASGPESPLLRSRTFAPDTLLSANPYGRSFAVRTRRAREVGGLNPDLGDDSFWDLLLRLNPTDSRVVHVPRILSHLGRRPAFAGIHATDVVDAHLTRLGTAATAKRRWGAIHLEWQRLKGPRVSIVVPSRHNEHLLEGLLESLRTTDYPDWELIIVDNGGRSDAHEQFYERAADGIDHRVLWWDEPFNYSAVNNAAVREATGEVVVLLNDDTVIRSPEWLYELTGLLGIPGVGTVGVQMIDPDGLIQHGGVIVGATGLADHRFQGLSPHSTTIIGSTDWYYDSIANTGACVAIRKDLWDTIGGLDEKFVLCGSDVVLGMDVRRRGLRNVCTPAIHIDHLESATRKTDVPEGDIFASYWRYSRFLRFGDPYHNPNVSLISRDPMLRAHDEPTALTRVSPALGRSFGGAFKQSASDADARAFAGACRADDATREKIDALHRANSGAIELETVNWFVPEFDNPFYGGLATIFRIANHLAVTHGVSNRFVVWGYPDERWFRSGLAAIFPEIADSEIVACPGLEAHIAEGMPEADVSIATQWQTAYQVAHFPATKRKFYLIQDFEPMFNPAGTLYALAEETYKLGLLGICNTPHLLDLYKSRYGGRGGAFVPAVDQEVFHSKSRSTRLDGDPITIFVYARPGHWRNCWELAEPALRMLKERFGQRIRIVTAGAWTDPSHLKSGMDHLGLLDYVETGDLYRTCDIGLSLTVSEHPSYLPLELMACGVPIVAFDLPAGYWILHDGENSLLAKRTVDGLYEKLCRMVDDESTRKQLAEGATRSIAASHSNWADNLSGIHGILTGQLDQGAS